MLESKLFWTFITILSTVFECVIFKIIISEISKLKSNKIKLNLMISMWVIIISLLTIINLDMNIKLCIGIFFSIMVYLYNFDEKLYKVLIVCSVFWLFLVALDGLSISIISLIYKTNDVSEILGNNRCRLEVMLMAKILLVLVVPAIKSINIKPTLKVKEILLIILPIVTNILSILVILALLFEVIESAEFKGLILVICMGLILISNFSLIFIIGKVMKESTLENENKIIRQKIESQYKHYLELQNAQLKIRKLYHDMNNHLVCIENMNNKGKSSKDYLSSLRKELDEWGSIDTTGNMIVDIILSEKRDVCRKENISFHADIKFMNSDFMDMMDICSMFSNILDNAIEASIKIEDTSNRNINIVCNTINKFFVIRCENSKANNILESSNKIFTDKKDKFVHGLGISSIKNSVEKYNGTVAIEHTDYKFIINIYIPII